MKKLPAMQIITAISTVAAFGLFCWTALNLDSCFLGISLEGFGLSLDARVENACAADAGEN